MRVPHELACNRCDCNTPQIDRSNGKAAPRGPTVPFSDAAARVTIIIASTTTQVARYEARLTGGCLLVRASRQPFLDAARKLVSLGFDPAATLTMRWAGSAIDCLTAPLGIAAKLTVDEHNGTRFAKWKALPRSAVLPKTARIERLGTEVAPASIY